MSPRMVVIGIPDPIVASRTQATILEEMGQGAGGEGGDRRARRPRGSALEHPRLFAAE